mgnify:CR=1 FL=1
MTIEKHKNRYDVRKAVIKLFWILLIVLLLLGNLVMVLNNRMLGVARPYILSVRFTLSLEDADRQEFERSMLESAGTWDFDCILVLGAKVKPSGDLSSVLQDRCEVGVAAYKLGAAPKLLLSGDHGTVGYDEVSAMQAYAEAQGVPPQDIFLDHAGFSTYDSMVRAKEVFGAERILIVTQPFHLSRAVYIARSIGLDAYGMGSDLRNYGPYSTVFNELREIAARAKDSFYVNVWKPAPKYRGESIDLGGDGRITHEER